MSSHEDSSQETSSIHSEEGENKRDSKRTSSKVQPTEKKDDKRDSKRTSSRKSKPEPPKEESTIGDRASKRADGEWEEHENDFGEKYWYNPKTDESTWDNPYADEEPAEYVSNFSFYSKKKAIKKSELHEAAFRGDLVELQKLLKGRFSFLKTEDISKKVNKLDKAKSTPLHYATFATHRQVVKFLLDNKADPKLKDGLGLTPLHLAAAKGWTEGVRDLLEADAEMNAKDEGGYTPLFYAVLRNQEETVRFLIEKGADLNLKNNDGETPLLSATLFDNMPMVKLLINKGAVANESDNSGRTPLHEAASSGNLDILKFLLDAKDAKQTVGSVQVQAGIDAKDKTGSTALHYATFFGRSECVEELIKHKADVNLTDNEGATCLHNAAFNNLTRAMKVLIKAGAEVNTVDGNGHTPLRTCALNGNTLGMRTLLKHGAKVEVTDTTGMTPLHVAAYGGHTLCVQILLNNKADLNALDKRGVSALSYAGYSGSIGCLMLLLQEFQKRKLSPDSPANINHTDTSGMSPLLTAVKWKRVEAVEYLISQGASLKAVNKKGQNAMHIALEHLATAYDPSARNTAFSMIALLEEEDDGSLELDKIERTSAMASHRLPAASARLLAKGVSTKNISAMKRKENQQRRYDFGDLQSYWKSPSPEPSTMRPKLERIETSKGKFDSSMRKPMTPSSSADKKVAFDDN